MFRKSYTPPAVFLRSGKFVSRLYVIWNKNILIKECSNEHI